MKWMIVWVLLWALLLSGCSGLLDGRYVSIQKHEVQQGQNGEDTAAVRDYNELMTTLKEMVRDGTESGILSVAAYNQNRITADMDRVIEYLMTSDPFGAYALARIDYELGTNAGQSAVALRIEYLHDRSELRRIMKIKTWDEAEALMAESLNNCDSGLVFYIENYRDVDFVQWVAHYAAANPDQVMEQPEVTANLYPEVGSQRIVELKYTYQTGRDALRTMQTQVRSIFDSAAIYIGSYSQEQEKYEQLYSFLMDFLVEGDYQLQTSITPAYSLLRHGVGDSKAFATVYAAMGAQADLECITVTGTRNAEPWFWNIIRCDGVYYHVDLLRSSEEAQFRMYTDEDMSGYVWDYSAYPACGIQPEAEEVK